MMNWYGSHWPGLCGAALAWPVGPFCLAWHQLGASSGGSLVGTRQLPWAILMMSQADMFSLGPDGVHRGAELQA